MHVSHLYIAVVCVGFAVFWLLLIICCTYCNACTGIYFAANVTGAVVIVAVMVVFVAAAVTDNVVVDAAAALLLSCSLSPSSLL